MNGADLGNFFIFVFTFVLVNCGRTCSWVSECIPPSWCKSWSIALLWWEARIFLPPFPGIFCTSPWKCRSLFAEEFRLKLCTLSKTWPTFHHLNTLRDHFQSDLCLYHLPKPTLNHLRKHLLSIIFLKNMELLFPSLTPKNIINFVFLF